MTRTPFPLAPSSELLSEHLTGVELVILDFDGVIADSEVLSLGTLKDTLDDYDLPLSSAEVRDRFLGTSLKTIGSFVAENSPRGTADGFTQAWQSKLFSRFRQDLRPVTGAKQFADHLRFHNIEFCIASSSSFERIGVAAQAMGLAATFPNVFSAEQVANGKPAPDLFLHAAEQMRTRPQQCLVIEDSPHGVRAARSANMRCYGFVGGQHLVGIEDQHATLLYNRGASRVLRGFDELLQSSDRTADVDSARQADRGMS